MSCRIMLLFFYNSQSAWHGKFPVIQHPYDRQIYEQHWLSFTYVNSEQAKRAVLGNASVCLQEEKKMGPCGERRKAREINKQMEAKLETGDGRKRLRSDEQKVRQSSGVK
ncbi:Hypothetical predicted protein [Xyrichtys novacula]|uniref:Uncharacterized protein n=1 Tax=Xyrichtys novacula TaxID=13765 RepID=A0AAV1GSW8_XYRNO|nr:Hypothetical predicted protein [Xyrichtys novacula]